MKIYPVGVVIVLAVVSFVYVIVNSMHKTVSHNLELKKEAETGTIDESSEFNNFPKEPNLSSAGVFVYGYSRPRNSFADTGSIWVENTNDFPVKILFEPSGHIHPMSRFLFTFQPGQVKNFGAACEDDYFYIYDDREESKGRPIGFIVPVKPKN